MRAAAGEDYYMVAFPKLLRYCREKHSEERCNCGRALRRDEIKFGYIITTDRFGREKKVVRHGRLLIIKLLIGERGFGMIWTSLSREVRRQYGKLMITEPLLVAGEFTKNASAARKLDFWHC